jgi:hypothetical protein
MLFTYEELLVDKLVLPCAVDEVVVGAEQLDCALLQPFLNERVGLEILEGHVHGFLQNNIQRPNK